MKIGFINIPMKEDFSMKSLLSFEKTPTNILVAVSALLFIVLGVVGAANYLIHGEGVYNITRQHRWGLLIAVYIFFVVSSTGLCIVGSLGDVFGFKDYMLISKRAIFGSIVTILSGFAVIAFDIGHPITMVTYIMLSPGFTSALFWMGALYSLYLTFMIIEFYFLLNNNMKKAKIFGLTGLAFGLIAHSNLGAVFGFLNTRTISQGVYYPVYFILTAFITGVFLAFIFMGFRYKLNFPEKVKVMLEGLTKILGLLIGVLILIMTWKAITDIYGGMPTRADAAKHIIAGTPFHLEVLFAMLIPLLVVLKDFGKSPVLMFWASMIGMVGIFFMRINVVNDTQVKPLQMMKIHEYQLPPSWIEYFPSSAEMMISLGGLGLCIAMYYAGTKLFNLDENEH